MDDLITILSSSQATLIPKISPFVIHYYVSPRKKFRRDCTNVNSSLNRHISEVTSLKGKKKVASYRRRDKLYGATTTFKTCPGRRWLNARTGKVPRTVVLKEKPLFLSRLVSFPRSSRKKFKRKNKATVSFTGVTDC